MANLPDKKEIFYEIHVTVRTKDINSFQAACQFIGIKAIVLDLQLERGNTLQDVMTSYVTREPNTIAQANRIELALQELGFISIRTKIETVPWNPRVPTKTNLLKIPQNSYFESHIAVISGISSQGILRPIVKAHDAHLSTNVFKKMDSESSIIMATLRSYAGYLEDHESRVESLRHDIALYGWKIKKVITEYTIYDSNLEHDKEWTNGN
jgi:hypothetical protein